MEGKYSLAKTYLKHLDKNSSLLCSTLIKEEKMEYDVNSFLLFDNSKFYEFIKDLVEERDIVADTKEVIKLYVYMSTNHIS